MSTEAALVDAIGEAPDDDVPRLRLEGASRHLETPRRGSREDLPFRPDYLWYPDDV